MSTAARLTSYAALLLAGLLGGASLLLFGLFLLRGSLDLLALPLEPAAALAFDAALCLTFFVQHSGMIRRCFRRALSRLLPDDYHAALYSIASGVVLATLVLLWQRVEPVFWAFEGGVRWLTWGLYAMALLGFAWAVRALGSFDAFGLRPILRRLSGRSAKAMPLTVRGPYRWVRHPLYTLILLMIWACPTITADRILFDVLFSAWLVLGAHLEERDLVAEFGEVYSEYQRRVPMLIPGMLPRA